MRRELQGTWYYRSFRSFAAVVDRSETPPDVKIPPLIAAPWTPRSEMEFQTDSSAKVTGSARLDKVEFRINGSITPAIGDDIPEGVELVITVDAFAAVYNLRGYFLEDSDHIVGSVVAISNDLGYQPDGTTGPFVLYPVRP